MSRNWLLPVVTLCLLFTGAGACASGLRDFTSDGCSLFPDRSIAGPGQWCECCFMHDIAYWRGGSEEDRKQADEELRVCVLESTGNKALANLMFDGVRAGGHPVFPNWYRWGYGWKYGRGYAPLTDQEWVRVAEKIERYFKNHPQGYCGTNKK